MLERPWMLRSMIQSALGAAVGNRPASGAPVLAFSLCREGVLNILGHLTSRHLRGIRGIDNDVDCWHRGSRERNELPALPVL